MQVLRTSTFTKWLGGLRDKVGRIRIEKRIDQAANNDYLGQTRSVGGGVYEMKLGFSPGYRLYYAFREESIIYLLAGGDKDSQQYDIRRAKELLMQIEEEEWRLN